MSLNRNYTDWEQIFRVSLSTLFPIGVTGLSGYFYSRKQDQLQWIEKAKKPNWVITNPNVLRIIDLVLVSPIGYAAHVVCQEARDADRKLALGLYGGALFVSALGIPAVICNNLKNLQCPCILKGFLLSKGIAATLFGATAFTFYKIDKTAGLLLLPITVWMAYGSVALAVTDVENLKAN